MKAVHHRIATPIRTDAGARRRVSPAVSTALAVIALMPGTIQAQSGQTVRAGAVNRTAQRHACADIASMPTTLTLTPEGRSVVRLQRELETVASVAAQRGEGAPEFRALVTVQKNVDSLMQVIVKQFGGGERTWVEFRGDTLRGFFDDRATRERIEAQIRELQPRVAALAAHGAPLRMPLMQAGWVGLRVSGSNIREASPEGLVTRYCGEYPVIEAVDAGSPAEKGGLQAGDTLLAFNGRDVLAVPIVHAQTFAPGQNLKVRVRRAGKLREVPLVVAEPRNDVRSTFSFSCTPGSNCAANVRRDSVFAFRYSVEPMMPSRAPGAAGGSATVGAPPVPAVGMLMREVGISLVAGAQVTVVNDELAQNLGLDQGLLVVRVLTGTPMADAGVRAGEVIRQINGAAATDVQMLQRAFTGVREVRMTLSSRGTQGRTVVVRW